MIDIGYLVHIKKTNQKFYLQLLVNWILVMIDIQERGVEIGSLDTPANVNDCFIILKIT